MAPNRVPPATQRSLVLCYNLAATRRPAGGVNSAGRVPASQAGCRGFDPRTPLHSFFRAISLATYAGPRTPGLVHRGLRSRTSEHSTRCCVAITRRGILHAVSYTHLRAHETV